MNAIRLNCAGNVDQAFVEHGHESGAMFLGQGAEYLLELLDVIVTVVRRERDSGEQDFNVRACQCGENLVEVAAGLVEGQAAKTVVAAKLDDYDFRMKKQDGAQTGDGVLGGGAAGSPIQNLVLIAAAVEIALQSVGKRLAGLETVARGDAVAVTNQ